MFLGINLHPLFTPKGWGFDEHNFSVQIWIFQSISGKRKKLYMNTSTSMWWGGKHIFNAEVDISFHFQEKYFCKLTITSKKEGI